MREHAKYLLLDGVACALVGAQLPVSRKGVEGVTALDDAGTAAIIGRGGRTTSAPSAAMLNSSSRPPLTWVRSPGLVSCWPPPSPAA